MINEWKKIVLGTILILILLYIYQSIDEYNSENRQIVGRLKNSSGTIRYRHEDVSIWKNITVQNQDFFDRDIIETGPNSFIEIELSNKKRFIISENSQVVLAIQKTSSSNILNLVLNNGFIKSKDTGNIEENMTIKVGDQTYRLGDTSNLSIKKIGEKIDLQVTKGNIQVLDKNSNESKIIRKSSLTYEELKNIFSKNKKNDNFLVDNFKNNYYAWIFDESSYIPVYFSFLKEFESRNYQVVVRLDGQKSFYFFPKKNENNYVLSVDFNYLKNWSKKLSQMDIPTMDWKIHFGIKNNKTDQIIWDEKFLTWYVVYWNDIPDHQLLYLNASFLDFGKNVFFSGKYKLSQAKTLLSQDGAYVYGKKNLEKIMNFVSINQGFSISKIHSWPSQESLIIANKNDISYAIPSKFNLYSQNRIKEIFNPELGFFGISSDFIPMRDLLQMSQNIKFFLQKNPFIFVLDEQVKKINSNLVIKNIQGRNLILKKSKGLFKKNVGIQYH